MKSMRTLMNLVTEARHHTLFDEAINALKARVEESNLEFDDEIVSRVTEIIEPSESILPTQWMHYLTGVGIAVIYSVIAKQNDMNAELVKVAKRKILSNASCKSVAGSTNPLKMLEKFVFRLNDVYSTADTEQYHSILKLNPLEMDKSIEFSSHINDMLEEAGKKEKDGKVQIDGDNEVIIDFGDGYSWVKMDRTSCSMEAAALGHCGNSASNNPNEKILSLRRDAGDGVHQHPTLTFIINDGILGEMKGRKNSKPSAKYHPYIVALLKHEMIEGISPVGYKPENNFEMSDLSEEDQREIYAMKGIDFDEKDYDEGGDREGDDALERAARRYTTNQSSANIRALEHELIQWFAEITSGEEDFGVNVIDDGVEITVPSRFTASNFSYDLYDVIDSYDDQEVDGFVESLASEADGYTSIFNDSEMQDKFAQYILDNYPDFVDSWIDEDESEEEQRESALVNFGEWLRTSYSDGDKFVKNIIQEYFHQYQIHIDQYSDSIIIDIINGHMNTWRILCSRCDAAYNELATKGIIFIPNNKISDFINLAIHYFSLWSWYSTISGNGEVDMDYEPFAELEGEAFFNEVVKYDIREKMREDYPLVDIDILEKSCVAVFNKL